MIGAVILRIERSDGEEFRADFSDWVIPSDGLEDFGTVNNDLTTVDNAIGDGSILVNKRVSSIDRTIKCYVTDASKNEILRHRVETFFNGRYSFKIYLTYMGRTRWCEGELRKFFCPTQNIYKRVYFSATFLCASPFMRSHEDFGENIAGVTPMAGFPYLSRINYGFPTARFDFGQQVGLYNDGDTATYCKAVFTAKGTVVNPKLVINDKYVRILKTMQEGDVIIIDFTKDPPTVTMNGENIIGNTDRTSSFDGMQLNIGDTEIRYEADSGSSLLDVSIYFNKLYNAI